MCREDTHVNVYEMIGHLKELWGEMYEDCSEELPSSVSVQRGKQQAHLKRMEVVREMLSGPLVIRKLMIVRLRKSLLNLEVGKFWGFWFFFLSGSQ